MRIIHSLLVMLTLTSVLGFYAYDRVGYFELSFIKDAASYSAVFLVIWELTGAILRENVLKKYEYALFPAFLLVNFILFGWGNWSQMLFLSLPAQFAGLIVLKLFFLRLERSFNVVSLPVEPEPAHEMTDINTDVGVQQIF